MGKLKDLTCGFVYILANDLMPGILKIGITVTTVDQRLAEINSLCSLPVPYRVAHYFECISPLAIESIVHERLADYRVSENKEFFRLSIAAAVRAVESVISEEGGCATSRDEVTCKDVVYISKALRERRLRMKMSQGDLARLVGVSRQWIVDFESGKATVRLGLVCDLCRALGVSLSIS